MKALIEKIRGMILPNGISRYKVGQKSKAQSMVEFALMLPLLLILFSGMIEFGFVLNTYLSLIDATRQTARVYSTKVPFEIDLLTEEKVDLPSYYSDAANLLVSTLNSNSYQIAYDNSIDNVLISVIGLDVVDATTDPPTITVIRHPDGQYYYAKNPGGSMTRYYDFDPGATDPEHYLKDYLTANDSTPLTSGLLIVEVYYTYEGTLKLPWVSMFASDASPLYLYASTVMPLASAKPDAPVSP